MLDKIETEVSRLAEAELEVLSAYSSRAAWPAGFAVYQRGAPADGVFVVVQGRVVLRSRVRAARGFVPWIAAPGETFGSEGLSTSGRYATDARTDVESETIFLSSEKLRAFVREQPRSALCLMSQLMAERTALLHKLRELTTMSVEERLISAIVRLAASGTFTGEDGGLALVPQRYRLLCELVGATRESVSLVLGRLAADGLVERHGSTLVIANVSALLLRLNADAVGDEPHLAPFVHPADGSGREQAVQ